MLLSTVGLVPGSSTGAGLAAASFDMRAAKRQSSDSNSNTGHSMPLSAAALA